MLINELVNNAVKHGGHQVELRLAVVKKAVTLEVSDDGPGFAEAFSAPTAAHFGLELVESIGRLDLGGGPIFTVLVLVIFKKMPWFFHYTVMSPTEENNPYLSVLKGSVEGLPPSTVIKDEIDPLRSEGKAYADKLQKAGITVKDKNYEDVTHEFFGMGAVLDKVKEAEAFAAEGLKSAFFH